MARKPKKKPQAQETEASKGYDDFLDDDSEDGDDPVDIDENVESAAGDKVRDWRDVEKYREERELRRQLDDLDVDDLL